MPPDQPGGTTSGHLPGPWRLSKSTRNAAPVKVTFVMCAPSGQRARSCGELTIVAWLISNGTYRNDCAGEYGPWMPLATSSAPACPEYVAVVVSRTSIEAVVCPGCSPTTALPRTFANELASEISKR